MIFSYLLLYFELNLHASQYRSSFLPVAYRAWREQNVIRKSLGQSNLFVRPSPEGVYDHPPPVVITTSLHLESVSTVKEQNMEFKAQFRFQQEWVDRRLSFDDRYLHFVRYTTDQMNSVWTPDTFFQNEKDGHYHTEDQPNFSFVIHQNGSIVYNRRLTMIFSCVMNFLKYPMDTQKCEIDFASYAYTTADIVYVWKDRPLTIYHGAKSMLPNFVIRSFTNGTCTSITNTGEYSCLKIILRLQRDFSFFLVQAYLPSTTLVTVAWLSYWIDWQATAARFPLVLFTLLTMITQSHAINANLPPVSYTKAIDVWSGTCVLFIFTSLIEYAFVNYQGIKEKKPGMMMMMMKTNQSQFNSDNPKRMVIRCHVWDAMVAWWSKHRHMLDELFVRARSASFAWEKNQRGAGNRIKRPATLAYECRVDYVVDVDDPQTIRYDFERVTSVGDNGNDGGSRRRRTNRSTNSLEPDVAFDEIDIRVETRRRFDLGRMCRSLKARSRAERIDFVFRILHPVAFVMFNVVYWVVYW